MADKTRNIRMPDDLWQRIGKRAETFGLTQSAWIRMALIRQLEAEESPGRR